MPEEVSEQGPSSEVKARHPTVWLTSSHGPSCTEAEAYIRTAGGARRTPSSAQQPTTTPTASSSSLPQGIDTTHGHPVPHPPAQGCAPTSQTNLSAPLLGPTRVVSALSTSTRTHTSDLLHLASTDLAGCPARNEQAVGCLLPGSPTPWRACRPTWMDRRRCALDRFLKGVTNWRQVESSRLRRRRRLPRPDPEYGAKIRHGCPRT
ncbi:hypothetical protein C8Q77DRAFT_181598 [Trametes polyzona]|nr:hypothetical protein C8Q77DRAFT_181598 [Trametes polyzona]